MAVQQINGFRLNWFYYRQQRQKTESFERLVFGAQSEYVISGAHFLRASCPSDNFVAAHLQKHLFAVPGQTNGFLPVSGFSVDENLSPLIRMILKKRSGFFRGHWQAGRIKFADAQVTADIQVAEQGACLTSGLQLV